MLKKISYVLNNECGLCNPQIIVQLPLTLTIMNVVTYYALFGADFYNKATECLFK